MRVFYAAESQSRRPVVYRQGRVEFGCAERCRRWGLVVGLGVLGRASTDREVNLWLSRPQADHPPIVEVVPLQFCPFCSDPVETCWVKSGNPNVKAICKKRG